MPSTSPPLSAASAISSARNDLPAFGRPAMYVRHAGISPGTRNSGGGKSASSSSRMVHVVRLGAGSLVISSASASSASTSASYARLTAPVPARPSPARPVPPVPDLPPGTRRTAA